MHGLGVDGFVVFLVKLNNSNGEKAIYYLSHFMRSAQKRSITIKAPVLTPGPMFAHKLKRPPKRQCTSFIGNGHRPHWQTRKAEPLGNTRDHTCVITGPGCKASGSSG